MSTTDGDASSTLDGAIADVLSGAPVLPDDGTPKPAETAPPGDDWSVDGPDDDEPYTLPPIVPATTHPPEPAPPAPRVPAPPAAVSPAVVPAVAPSPTVSPSSAPAAPITPPPATAPVTAPATSWADHMTTVPAGGQGAALRSPGRRPRVRRVTRVLRHIDPWSTFKVAVLFSIVAYLVTLTAGVLLWRVADSTGTLDNVERWFTQFGWETFELKGDEIFRNAWIIGLFGAVAMTGALVLLATLFNLVSDIVGGVRMTVLEEEVVERTVSSTRRYVVRRPPTGGGGAGDWDVDDDTAPQPVDPTADVVATDHVAPAAADWSIDDADDDADDTDAGDEGDDADAEGDDVDTASEQVADEPRPG